MLVQGLGLTRATCCYWTCLKFLHSEVVGKLKHQLWPEPSDVFWTLRNYEKYVEPSQKSFSAVQKHFPFSHFLNLTFTFQPIYLTIQKLPLKADHTNHYGDYYQSDTYCLWNPLHGTCSKKVKICIDFKLTRITCNLKVLANAYSSQMLIFRLFSSWTKIGTIHQKLNLYNRDY